MTKEYFKQFCWHPWELCAAVYLAYGTRRQESKHEVHTFHDHLSMFLFEVTYPKPHLNCVADAGRDSCPVFNFYKNEAIVL